MTNDPILITGVGKRLGLHLAKTFLQRGIPVIGTYRTARDSLAELETKGAHLIQCDFYEAEQIEQLVSVTGNDYSGIRALIHNASDWLPDDADLSPSEILQRMMQVHVQVPYQLNQALTPSLMNSHASYTDIIHVGDFVSSKGSKKHIAYAASKAAQDNLTLSFAAKLAPKVKVNSVAPALMLFNDDDNEAYREKTLKKSLLEREGGYAEFQQAVDYLMDSEYITGRVLPLDGGRHLK